MEYKDINFRLFSSFLFFINVYVNYINQHYLHSFLFSNLLISSVILHWVQFDYIHLIKEIRMIKYVNKFNVFLVVINGLYIFISKLLSDKKNFILPSLVVHFLIICGYLWIYGSYKNKYCFDNNPVKAQIYHSIMHLSGILGHLILVLM